MRRKKTEERRMSTIHKLYKQSNATPRNFKFSEIILHCLFLEGDVSYTASG